ncbi:MAG: hypothetical protein R6U10_06745 [Thermoplasmatota archaeon]
MKKLLVLLAIGILVAPALLTTAPAAADDSPEKVTAEIEQISPTGVITRTVTLDADEAAAVERDIANDNVDSAMARLGINFDIGFSNLIFSYGKGEVYVPLARDCALLSPENGFLFRFIFRPIFFNYHSGGVTMVKFGANYFWKGRTVRDFGFMLGDQAGMMLGFYGTHIRIPWLLRPDTHIFVGGNLMTVGYNKFL